VEVTADDTHLLWTTINLKCLMPAGRNGSGSKGKVAISSCDGNGCSGGDGIAEEGGTEEGSTVALVGGIEAAEAEGATCCASLSLLATV
jgi:hypothetical protein